MSLLFLLVRRLLKAMKVLMISHSIKDTRQSSRRLSPIIKGDLQENYIMFQYIKPIIQYCKKSYIEIK
jgi:hypothetical protein